MQMRKKGWRERREKDRESGWTETGEHVVDGVRERESRIEMGE